MASGCGSFQLCYPAGTPPPRCLLPVDARVHKVRPQAPLPAQLRCPTALPALQAPASGRTRAPEGPSALRPPSACQAEPRHVDNRRSLAAAVRQCGCCNQKTLDTVQPSLYPWLQQCWSWKGIMLYTIQSKLCLPCQKVQCRCLNIGACSKLKQRIAPACTACMNRCLTGTAMLIGQAHLSPRHAHACWCHGNLEGAVCRVQHTICRMQGAACNMLNAGCCSRMWTAKK